MKQGKISQVIGPVVDVVFDGDYLPRIKEALTVEVEGKKLVMEVAKHMGGRTVRCILLDAAEGLARDMIVTATGSAISAALGFAAALILAFRGKSLLTVAIIASATVLVCELILPSLPL